MRPQAQQGKRGGMRIASAMSVVAKVAIVAVAGVLLVLLADWVRDVDRQMFGGVTVERVQGEDRYQTAVQLSQQRFPDPVGGVTAYVTSGTSFADALYAGPVVADDDAATLLPVGPDGVPATVAEELRRLSPESIVIVGGPGVVSPQAEQELRELGGDVTRLAGGDRFATAVRLNQERFPDPAPEQLTVYLTSGTSFADALFAGPVVAAGDDAALLPVAERRLPAVVAEELRRLQPRQVVIVGGTGVVSAETEQQVRQISGIRGVVRIAGENRFETAARLSQQRFPRPPDVDVTAYLVSATAFADALFAGPVVAAQEAATMLPVQVDEVPEDIAGELRRLEPTSIVVVGGTSAISEQTERGLRD